MNDNQMKELEALGLTKIKGTEHEVYLRMMRDRTMAESLDDFDYFVQSKTTGQPMYYSTAYIEGEGPEKMKQYIQDWHDGKSPYDDSEDTMQ